MLLTDDEISLVHDEWGKTDDGDYIDMLLKAQLRKDAEGLVSVLTSNDSIGRKLIKITDIVAVWQKEVAK